MSRMILIVGCARSGKSKLTFSGRFKDCKYYPFYFIRSYSAAHKKPPPDFEDHIRGDKWFCKSKKRVVSVAKPLFDRFKIKKQIARRKDNHNVEVKFLQRVLGVWYGDHILLEGEYISKANVFLQTIEVARGFGRRIEIYFTRAKPSVLFRRCTKGMLKDRYGGLSSYDIQTLFARREGEIFRMLRNNLRLFDKLEIIDTGREVLLAK